MSDFKAKMHQIRFRLGLRPRPRWESLQCSPDPLPGFEGPTSIREGREGKGRGERRRDGRKGEGGEGKGEDAFLVMWPRKLSALNSPLATEPHRGPLRACTQIFKNILRQSVVIVKMKRP